MNTRNVFHTFLCAAAAGLGMVSESPAFDLSADRARTIESLRSYGYSDYYVYNVDPPQNPGSDWSVPSVSGTPWYHAQFRNGSGKKVGVTSEKVSSAQYDFSSYKLNNGWFTPGPKLHSSCCGISSGWQDTYSGCPMPSMDGGSDGIYKPNTGDIWVSPPNGNYSLHIRNDPTNRYSGDKNKRNNDMWYSGKWTYGGQAASASFIADENADLGSGTYNLSDGDTLLVGPYSTNLTKGNITLSQTTTYNLTSRYQMIGYQAQRMKVTLTGGRKATYKMTAGSSTVGLFGKDLYSTPL